jgi:hypothetical protein
MERSPRLFYSRRWPAISVTMVSELQRKRFSLREMKSQILGRGKLKANADELVAALEIQAYNAIDKL